jgi:NADPH2:quinone reductase
LRRYLPVDDPECLLDLELPVPSPAGRDLRVKVLALAVNPVDTKLRAPKPGVEDPPRVLGFDAAGVVDALGEAVSGFAPGDEVYYSGDLTRPGCNAEFQLVDERLVARKPSSLDFTASAALPLVSLTAWELLHERMGVDPGGRHAGEAALVIGGAGGMASMTIQLAKLAGLRVVATASRPASAAWCRSYGADEVIDARQPMLPQLESLGVVEFPWILNLVNTEAYWRQTADLIAPFGSLGLIVEPREKLHLGDPLKMKCVRICWEFMAARAKFRCPDMAGQGRILAEVAALVDAGRLRSPLGRVLSPVHAANLRTAHAEMEAGTAVGKTVLTGW